MSHHDAQREADEIWKNAPEGAEFFAAKTFYKRSVGGFLFWHHGEWLNSDREHSDMVRLDDYCERPQPKPKYEYGVEYPTNRQKPDLPDDVLVEFRSRDHGQWNQFGAMPLGQFRWGHSSSFRIVDDRYKPKQPVNAQDAPKPQGPYQRTIIGSDGSKCVVDVYRVLEAFEVDSHAIAHAIKKLLAPGKRHAKTREQDLREAIASIEAELLLMSQR